MMCKCEDDYMLKSSDSKCLKKYDKECAADADCYSGKCTNKKCACANADENYSKQKMMCVAGVLFDGDCTSKACYGTNLQCSSGKKCECKSDFKKKDTNDDVCSEPKVAKKIYGATCANDAECNDKANLKCVGDPKKCGCSDTTNYEKKSVPYTDDKGVTTMWDKCLHKNATMDVKKDQDCTTENYGKDAMFCAKDLKCMKCGTSNEMKCRGKSSDPSGAVQVTFSLLAAIGCLALRKVLM